MKYLLATVFRMPALQWNTYAYFVVVVVVVVVEMWFTYKIACWYIFRITHHSAQLLGSFILRVLMSVSCLIKDVSANKSQYSLSWKWRSTWCWGKGLVWLRQLRSQPLLCKISGSWLHNVNSSLKGSRWKLSGQVLLQSLGKKCRQLIRNHLDKRFYLSQKGCQIYVLLLSTNLSNIQVRTTYTLYFLISNHVFPKGWSRFWINLRLGFKIKKHWTESANIYNTWMFRQHWMF